MNIRKPTTMPDNLDLFDDVNLPLQRGRPRLYSSNAERQKAYRARLKMRGKRVMSRVVDDDWEVVNAINKNNIK